MDIALTTIIGISIIFLATTLGSAFVFFLRKSEISPRLSQILSGLAAGIMLSASFFSLLLPAIKMEVTYMPSWLVAAIAVLLGAAFLWGIDHLLPHLHVAQGKEEGLKNPRMNKTAKMFLAVTIHNIPEGLSVGIAFGVALAFNRDHPGDAASIAALSGALSLAIGIALQNIPEGAVVSLPVKAETKSTGKAFLFGTLSGAVEPIAAVVGLFLAFSIQVIMPWALCFAAGCMIYVIAEEMIPDAKGDPTHHDGVWAFLIGFVIMMVLDIAFGE